MKEYGKNTNMEFRTYRMYDIPEDLDLSEIPLPTLGIPGFDESIFGEDVWTTGDGRNMRVSQMTDEHLTNATRCLLTRARRDMDEHATRFNMNPKDLDVEDFMSTRMPMLRKEAKRRGMKIGPSMNDKIKQRKQEMRRKSNVDKFKEELNTPRDIEL
jgi:hypothetical protein